MKKVLAAVLCLVMALGALSACDSAGSSKSVTVYFFGSSVTEDAGAIEAANARLAELGLDFTINPIWGDWAAGDRIQSALDTGNTTIDVVFTCSWDVHYVPNALRGNFARLDDPKNNLLEKYGKDVKAEVSDFLWDGFTVDIGDGPGIYAVPGVKDYAQMHTWDINNTRLAELGYDIDSFDWDASVLFDPRFEEVLAAAKEKYGNNFYPLLPEPDNFLRSMLYNDSDITTLGVIAFPFDPEDPSQPEDYLPGLIYEDEATIKVLEKLHDFYKKGYIDPRTAIREEANQAISGSQEAGLYLFSQRTYAYGFQETASHDRGIDARFMPISASIVSTIPVQGSGFGISVYSKKQDLAMQFLNAWYTDKELATILAYGVEGDHFEYNDDGTITLDTERRATYSPWRNGMGNIFILPPQDVEGVDYYAEFKEYNEEGVGTTILGFIFNPEAVETEIAALTSVVDEYEASITTGAVDPAVKVPEFIDKLYANGVQKVLDELHKQLQAFYDSRK